MFAVRITILILTLVIASCATFRPKNADNLCDIFRSNNAWAEAAIESEKRWGISEPIMMSIMFQESSYRSSVRPPREWLFGIIPWFRPSSAYGYAQATDEAWDDYKKATGGWFLERDDFDDAIDFIGWYNSRSSRLLGIRKNDAYNLYLAYHEGPGGYRKKSWKRKPKLVRIAKKVESRSKTYRRQYNTCKHEFHSSWWWPF